MRLDVEARIQVGLHVRPGASSPSPAEQMRGRIHPEAAAIVACADVADRTSLRPAMQRITQKLAQAKWEGEGRTWNGCA